MSQLITKTLVLVVLIWTVALSWVTTSASAEERIALVIGNSAYTHTSALRNPAKDARDVAAALRRLQFTVSEYHDLSFLEMRDAVIKFGHEARSADMAVLYFAGHGMEVGGENWLIPVDAKLLADVDAEDEAIELSYVMGKLRGTRKLGLVILDACRNNPFSAKMTRTAGINRAVTRGFTRVEPEGNILVAYAAREGTLAQDGKLGENSPYATAILQHIETPNLDIQFIFRRVRDTVKTASKGIQIPHTYGSLPGQQIILNAKAARKDELNQTTKTQTTAVNACSVWPQISETKSVAQINTFLKECQTGIYSSLARSRLKEIEPVKVAVGVFPKEQKTPREPVIELKVHWEDIWSVAISPDSRFVVTGSADRTARIWDTKSGNSLHALEGHGEGITSVTISPDSRFIVTGSVDKTARIWDTESGNLLHDLGLNESYNHSIAITPNSQLIVIGSKDQTARIWEAATGKLIRELKGHEGPVGAVAISPNGRFIVTRSKKTVRIWDTDDGSLIHVLKGHKKRIFEIAISPDSRFVVTGAGEDGIALIWNADNGSIRHELKGHNGYITSVAISSDDRFIVTAARDDKTARVWDAETGKQRYELADQKDVIYSVAISSDSRFIVTGSGNNNAQIWNTEDGTLLHELKGHASYITSVAISPDNRFIVTRSGDSAALIWDISNILGITPKKDKQVASLQLEQDKLSRAQDDHPITECDRLASDPWDPKSLTKGVSDYEASSQEAEKVCNEAVTQFPKSLRLKALHARSIYYRQGTDDEVIKGLKLAVKSGNATALYDIAERYDDGYGFSEDKVEAAKWYQAAVDAGHAQAMYKLGEGYRYDFILGPEVDKIRAFELIKKAAELNHPEAAETLSGMYLSGEGTLKELDLGIFWLKKAGELNWPSALGQLGRLYEKGSIGYEIPKDTYKAMAYHLRAAELNYSSSFRPLIFAFDTGVGTAFDPERAAHYLILWDRDAIMEDHFWKLFRTELSTATAKALQQKLKDVGFYRGRIDGKLGPGSRKALDEYTKTL